jgi:hypothetical protein
MAKKKYTISFDEAQATIAEPITKFGGQPVWIEQPQWPLSRQTGEPMRFIGQIALDTELFGEPAGRVAYLFISDGETFVDNTYDPEGGENAVIIQPGGGCEVTTQPLPAGPSVQKWIDLPDEQRRDYVDCEFGYVFLSEDGTSGKFLWQCA